jgi:hypothetical protein
MSQPMLKAVAQPAENLLGVVDELHLAITYARGFMVALRTLECVDEEEHAGVQATAKRTSSGCRSCVTSSNGIISPRG